MTQISYHFRRSDSTVCVISHVFKCAKIQMVAFASTSSLFTTKSQTAQQTHIRKTFVFVCEPKNRF